MGLALAPFQKVAAKAFQDGITHNEATGPLKRYMSKLYMAQRVCNNIRIYGEFVFLFKEDCLITVWGLPNELKPIAAKIREKKKSCES